MPRTTKEESADLSIKLINPGTPFYAGSVIIGHVIRKSPITTPFATIRVRLKARAKVRLAVHFQDSGDNIFRSQFNFWPENAVAETLHEGELQVPSSLGEADSWPFALTIPTHTNAKGLNTGLDNDARKACFLNLPEDKEGKLGVPEQPLPGTFYTEHTGSERSFQSFVEFWIEAELKMRPTREAQTVQAKLPVTVLFAPSPSPPITNFARMRRIAAGCVSTQRLFPGMENAKLSFMQRSKKYFGSTKIPVLRFSLDVIYPTVIQLGNPAIIPFALRFNPIKDRSSDVIQDMPRIYLESTALEIHSTTEVVVPFRRKPIYDDKTRKTCVGTSMAGASDRRKRVDQGRGGTSTRETGAHISNTYDIFH
ncbi:uncharacterized protein CTRU02_203282 [Colletotrichum truncatum]|uniref:Uncharacterized protein n=1 Tax=Colletotrichum truncatum TaxID=5467 RepID=A0ACC3Z8X0_COLTU|nr:uncharacterized protein CTRU02_15539 [Colletotrichum truncatum]KAF6780957.1 hypothetical protein CTRU02_15539 [Colletotrichum truncatum]